MPRPSANKLKNNVPLKYASRNASKPKAKEKKDENSRHAEQATTSFRIETKIAKIKIVDPLIELLKNADY